MPGCTHISGYLHMTTQTEVLIETLKALHSHLCCCSGNIFSNQDHAVAVIIRDEYAAVFSSKGKSLEEYWEGTPNALIWTEDDGKGHSPDLIVDERVTRLF